MTFSYNGQALSKVETIRQTPDGTADVPLGFTFFFFFFEETGTQSVHLLLNKGQPILNSGIKQCQPSVILQEDPFI